MSRRHGGLVKNFKGLKDDWSSIKSSSSTALAPESIKNLSYTDAGGIWTIKSTVDFPRAEVPAAFSIIGQTSLASNGTVTSGTLLTPAGTQVGDMLIAVQFSTVQNVTPSGWTLGGTVSSNSANPNTSTSVYYQVLTSAPASSYTFTTGSIGVVNFALIVLRKAAGSPAFGTIASIVDANLAQVQYNAFTVGAPSAFFAVSSVRGATTTGVVVPNLASPYTEYVDITNTTSSSGSRMLMVEMKLVDPGTITTPTKSLPSTSNGATGITFNVS